MTRLSRPALRAPARLLPGSTVALALLLLLPARARAAAAPACPAGSAITTFKLLAKPAGAGPALALSAVNRLEPGEAIVYEPVGRASARDKKAAVALIVISNDSSVAPRILPARPAGAEAEWPVPGRAAAIGLVLGPRGVDEKKLARLLQTDPAAVDRLADYADETSKVEALVQALSKYEQSAPDSGGLQSALTGFSSQYGVSLPAIDRSKPADQQAATLLRAITPALAADAPARPSLVQQSGGLAAAVASLFFGPPAGLAIGGVSLAGTLHASLFPPTDFRSAFTEPIDRGALALCTAGAPRPARTRLEYVWMLRLTDEAPPASCSADRAHVPLGWTGAVTAHCTSVAQLKALGRAREWRLVSGALGRPVPASVAVAETSDAVTLNLTHVSVPPGDYRLTAMWDWTPVALGPVDVRPIADLSSAALTPESEDRAIAGARLVPIDFTGPDFEFVDAMTLANAAAPDAATPLAFTLPKGKAGGEQHTIEARLDLHALDAGRYLVTMTQVNGARHAVPVTVHPASPTLARLPLRANVGDRRQTILLHGTGLERLERIASRGAVWTLAPVANGARATTERRVEIALDGSAHEGDRDAVSLFVSGLHQPIVLADALEVIGRRPAIVGAKTSIADGAGVELRANELPSGVAVSFVVQTNDEGKSPSVHLACESDDRGAGLTVAAGRKSASGTLDLIDPHTLFLSVDPGRVGPSGCAIEARVTSEATGTSDPYPLGRVVHLPRIDRFTIETDAIAKDLYAGTLAGDGLETIEKTGWNDASGFPVQGIATPVPGSPDRQTLAIAVPWPPPSPHAPLYVWLRGERQGRRTSARY